MKLLLLGKDGQVGWQLQRSLAPHGEVVPFGHGECDLAQSSELRSLVRRVAPDVIVNAAAFTAVDRAEQEPEQAMLINAIAPGVLADEMALSGGLLIHYSTDYVFDGQKSGAYAEGDDPNPINVYGSSKLAGERAIWRSGAKAVVFRTSWVFGARGSNFVKTILRLAQERDSLDVVADQFGVPTPAALIATVTGVVLAMLRQGRQMGAGEQRIYHLSGAGRVSWHEFAQEIVFFAKAAGLGSAQKLQPDMIRAIPSEAYPTLAARPKNSCLDCSRLERDFDLLMPDWRPYLQRMMQLLILKQRGY